MIAFDAESLILRLFPATERSHAETELAIGEKRYRVFADLTTVLTLSPPVPTVQSISCVWSDSMAALLATVHLSPATPDVTSRLVHLIVNAGAPTTIDVFDVTTTFPCNEGDSVVATAEDVNSFGTSMTSDAFNWTAALTPPPPPPPAVPATPTVLGISAVLA